MPKTVFVTGGTGALGRALIPALQARGHHVIALVRPGSESRLPPGIEVVSGNPLDRSTFEKAIPAGAAFVQLVGVSHPSPFKAKQFQAIDAISARESLAAARAARVSHFIYLSVAQPAPTMRAYVAVRKEGERLILESGLPATFVRPWYVLGPGRRWPMVLLPFYWILEQIPATRGGAQRLGFVTLREMTAALVGSIEKPPTEGVRIVDVPAMREIGKRGL